MKRSVVSVFAVLLLIAMLGACGAPAAQTPSPATPEPVVSPTLEPTAPPTQAPTPAPTDRGEKTGLYYPGEYTAKAKATAAMWS